MEAGSHFVGNILALARQSKQDALHRNKMCKQTQRKYSLPCCWSSLQTDAWCRCTQQRSCGEDHPAARPFPLLSHFLFTHKLLPYDSPHLWLEAPRPGMRNAWPLHGFRTEEHRGFSQMFSWANESFPWVLGVKTSPWLLPNPPVSHIFLAAVQRDSPRWSLDCGRLTPTDRATASSMTLCGSAAVFRPWFEGRQINRHTPHCTQSSSVPASGSRATHRGENGEGGQYLCSLPLCVCVCVFSARTNHELELKLLTCIRVPVMCKHCHPGSQFHRHTYMQTHTHKNTLLQLPNKRQVLLSVRVSCSLMLRVIRSGDSDSSIGYCCRTDLLTHTLYWAERNGFSFKDPL